MRSLSAILLFALCISCITNDEGNRHHFTPLFTQLDSLLEASDFNGVIAIAEGDEVLYSRTIGFSDISAQTPLKLDDQFVIGSISKQITAVLVLREVEKKTIHLEDTIGRYLENLDQEWAEEITIHQLLVHTHGIVDLEESLAFEPGSQFQYSQLGYDLLAKILENITGQSFEALSTALFESAGLSHTVYPDLLITQNLVNGYVEDESDELVVSPNSLYNYPAAGSFISTAEDLIQWNHLLHSGQLLQPETVKLMSTPYATRQHPIFGEVEYGYGLLFQQGEQDLEIGALGYAPGFVSASYAYPRSNLTLVILQNTARHLDNFAQTFGVHLAVMEVVRKMNI